LTPLTEGADNKITLFPPHDSKIHEKKVINTAFFSHVITEQSALSVNTNGYMKRMAQILTDN